MTSDPKAKLNYVHDLIGPRLKDAGYSEAAIHALFDFDMENFHYVRRVMKGDIPQSLMDELGTTIEASQFQAMAAIMRIAAGFGRNAPEEPTVGLLAEELCVDPSRASRIAADLVARGLVARGASQSDGRKSILVPTDLARAMMGDFLRLKWQRQAAIFADWDETDIIAFARLFTRYSEGMRRYYPVTSTPSREE